MFLFTFRHARAQQFLHEIHFKHKNFISYESKRMSDFIKRIPHSMHELAVHIFCHTIWQHYYCNFNQNDIDFVIMIVLIYISMIIYAGCRYDLYHR